MEAPAKKKAKEKHFVGEIRKRLDHNLRLHFTLPRSASF
jgi:hypothetical protein